MGYLSMAKKAGGAAKKEKPVFQALNNREAKPILAYLTEHFGFEGTLDYAFILTAKNKLYAASKEIFNLAVEELRVSSFGVYFGEWRDDQLRPSIEGSQIIGPKCTKNVIDLTIDQRNQWMNGEQINRTEQMIETHGVVILRCEDDYLGSGKISTELIYNYVPKNRRVRFSL